MSSRERRLARAVYLMHEEMRVYGADLRSARLTAGMTLDEVGNVVGVSGSTILRVERGTPPGPRSEMLARHAAAVGMRARIRVFPDGPPLRDAGQVALIRSFQDACPGLALSLEVPVLARPGDPRAFDAVVHLGDVRCALEFVTRFHDCQAQLRAGLLKQADAGIERLVFIVAATHVNRAAVAAAADVMRDTLPLGTRTVLAALRAGRDPGANGLAFV